MKPLNLITLAIPLALFSACAVTPRVAFAERASTSHASPCMQASNMKLTKEREGFEDPDNAIRLLSECLSGWPDAPIEYRALSLQMRAVAHAQKKDYTHAIADREESLRLTPPGTGWDFISLASDYRENGHRIGRLSCSIRCSRAIWVLEARARPPACRVTTISDARRAAALVECRRSVF